MLNPKKWNVFCWIALLLWMVPASLGNIPSDPEISEPEEIAMPGGATAIAYDHTYLTGWPFAYLETTKKPNVPTARTYRYSLLLLNFALIAGAMFGLVYSIQTFIPQFSILTLLVVITCIAILFPVGHLVFSTDNYTLQTGFMFSIYFAPLVATIPAFIYSRHRNHHE